MVLPAPVVYTVFGLLVFFPLAAAFGRFFGWSDPSAPIAKVEDSKLKEVEAELNKKLNSGGAGHIVEEDNMDRKLLDIGGGADERSKRRGDSLDRWDGDGDGDGDAGSSSNPSVGAADDVESGEPVRGRPPSPSPSMMSDMVKPPMGDVTLGSSLDDVTGDVTGDVTSPSSGSGSAGSGSAGSGSAPGSRRGSSNPGSRRSSRPPSRNSRTPRASSSAVPSSPSVTPPVETETSLDDEVSM